MLRPRVLAAVASAALLSAACTSGSGSTPALGTSVVTSTAPAPTVTPTPVSSGPTTAAAASTCPLAGEEFVHETMGVRLGRLTVLRSGGKVVGCRFYAQQHPDSQCDATCLAKEKLPGPGQPAVEIVTQRYASTTAAHNAFVLRAGTSANVTQVAVAGTTGLCYPTAFDPRDAGNDFACSANSGATVVLVRTIDTTHSTSTSTVLGAVLHAVAQ